MMRNIHLFILLLGQAAALKITDHWADGLDKDTESFDENLESAFELDGGMVMLHTYEDFEKGGGNPTYHAAIQDIRGKLKKEKTLNFPNKRNLEDWEKMFAESVERGRADPCNAEIVTGFARNNNAYGSNALLFMNSVTLALYYNKSLSICESSYQKSFWKTHFQDPHQMGVCREKKACDINTYDANLGNDLSRQLFRLDKHHLYEMKRFIYNKYYTFLPEVEERMKESLKQQGFDPTQKYIGMHIRHGDKAHSEGHVNLPPKVYAGKAQELLQDGLSHDTAIYLASDDPQAKTGTQQALQANGFSTPVFTTFDKDADRMYKKGFNKGGDYRPEQLASIDILMRDIYALNHANAFIGTQNSNMGVATFYARNAENAYDRTRFVDNTWGHWYML